MKMTKIFTTIICTDLFQGNQYIRALFIAGCFLECAMWIILTSQCYSTMINSMAYGTRRFNAAFTRALQ